MLKLALSFSSRVAGALGGPFAAGLVLACVLPLLFLQCSRSSLEDLRGQHQALELEYAALQANLARCREATSLHETMLVARELESVKLSNKYNILREELLRSLLTMENNDVTREVSVESPSGPSGESFKTWCAQPLPLTVRELFAGSAASTGAFLPAAPGAAFNGDSVAGNSRS